MTEDILEINGKKQRESNMDTNTCTERSEEDVKKQNKLGIMKMCSNRYGSKNRC